MKTVILPLVFLFCLSGVIYARDWKELHEQADSYNSEEAMALLKNNPTEESLNYLLGLTYLNEHKDKDAQRVFSEIDAKDPKAKWGLAEVLRRGRDYKKSEEMLQEVIKENPDFAPAYISLAYIRYIRRNFSESLRLAHKVMDLRLDNVDASSYVRACLIAAASRGMLAHYGGPLAKILNGNAAKSNIMKAESLQPDSAEVMLGVGSYYLLAPAFVGGNIDKALDYLERAVKKDSLLADAYVRLAQVYKLKGEYQLYEKNIEEALRIDPQNELALDIKNKECRFICVEQVKR